MDLTDPATPNTNLLNVDEPDTLHGDTGNLNLLSSSVKLSAKGKKGLTPIDTTLLLSPVFTRQTKCEQ